MPEFEQAINHAFVSFSSLVISLCLSLSLFLLSLLSFFPEPSLRFLRTMAKSPKRRSFVLDGSCAGRPSTTSRRQGGGTDGEDSTDGEGRRRTERKARTAEFPSFLNPFGPIRETVVARPIRASAGLAGLEAPHLARPLVLLPEPVPLFVNTLRNNVFKIVVSKGVYEKT